MDAGKVWLTAAFVAFFALCGKKLWQVLIGASQRHADTVARQLEEAKRLREEAQNLLATTKREQKQAQKDAADMIQQANAKAAAIKAQALDDLEASIKTMQLAAQARIAQAEAQALEALKKELVTRLIDKARDHAANQSGSNPDQFGIRQLQSL